MTLLIRSTVAALFTAFLVTACTSPLDTDAPRKEIPTSPAIKVTPTSISVDFTSAAGTYAIKGLPSIRIDTTVTPMRFWIDLTMEAVNVSGKGPMLHEFRVRLDSFPGDGLITKLVNGEVAFTADFGGGLQTYPSEANTNTASIIIAEQQHVSGKPREATITLYIIMNKDGFFVGAGQEQTLGALQLVI
ncbi:MAG: hypothetical protein NTX15_10830 [Candidatus Kapabacteria bacterium]|nr:hypothetical protein [Candidatus Kapabacteria bacterium]